MPLTEKSLIAALALLWLGGGPLRADFSYPTLPGPFNVVAGSGVNIALNNAGNSAGVTADTYRFWQLTTNWVGAGGVPWSSESRVTMNWSGGNSDGPLVPFAGGANNGSATVLTFVGGLSPFYDPSGDASMSVFLNQTFIGSNATWTNVGVTLISSIPPPGTLDTLDLSGFGSDTSAAAHGQNSVSWFQIIHPGGLLNVNTNGSDFDTELAVYDSLGFLLATDDDGGIGVQSSLDLGLSSGTYYAAVSGFDAIFFDGFNLNSGFFGGNLLITATAIPEPAMPGLIAALLALGALRRSRQSSS